MAIHSLQYAILRTFDTFPILMSAKELHDIFLPAMGGGGYPVKTINNALHALLKEKKVEFLTGIPPKTIWHKAPLLKEGFAFAPFSGKVKKPHRRKTGSANQQLKEAILRAFRTYPIRMTAGDLEDLFLPKISGGSGYQIKEILDSLYELEDERKIQLIIATNDRCFWQEPDFLSRYGSKHKANSSVLINFHG